MQRCIFGLDTLMAMKCVSYLPFIASASILNIAVFVTCICGYFFAGEKVSFPELVAIAGGFAGVLLILNPSLFGQFQMSDMALKLRASSDM